MIFFLSFAVQTFSISCSSYSCPPSGFKFTNTSVCTQPQNSSFYVQSCLSGLNCNPASGQCESTETNPELGYPGDYCTSNSRCSSQSCVSGICQGGKLDSKCSDHHDCNPGLRCAANGVCTNLIQIGSAGCNNDYDCVNNAGCNMTGSTGKCLEYFSQPIGSTVADCNSGSSNLCKTAQCSKSPKFGNLGVCKVSVQSVKNLPVACQSNLDCVGTDGAGTFTGTCSCGYNVNKTAYCLPFPGDLPGLNYFASWKSALNATNGVCNTLKRFTEGCLQQVDQNEKVLGATWGYLHYNLIQNNDNCVKATLTNDYYEEDWGIILSISLVYFL